MRGQMVATAGDGTRLAVQCQGEGPPLVLLAGQASNHHWWDTTRADFDPARGTITMDYRGTGASGKPDGPYSTRLIADDVIAVLDALGVGRADVYGTSMGGRVAQWVAIWYPERVGRLVLGCTSPGGAHAVERSMEVRRALMRRDSDNILADLMFTPEWRAGHPGPYRVLGDKEMPIHARKGHLAASNTHDAWHDLPAITAPTLILHGSDDQLTPAVNAELLAERIPGARTHIFPGARHAYFEECRPQASELAIEFLTS